MGGSDQWGNITAGTEFVRRNLEGKAYAVTTPLLTKADGSKFGKSEAGNIWLDAKLTGAYEFYQFWIRSNDADIPTYLKYFSLRSKEDILADCAVFDVEKPEYKDVSPVKKRLATELTERVHGADGLAAAERVTNLIFGKGASADVATLDVPTLKFLSTELKEATITASELGDNLSLIDFLAATKIVASKSEARRAIQGNAISINKDKISDVEAIISANKLLHGKYLLVDNGKKKKYLVTVE